MTKINDNISNTGEINFIESIKNRYKTFGKDLILGIGDDAAIFRSKDDIFVITADMLVENTHFQFSSISPYNLGRKSAAVNFSDIAAMGCESLYLLISLGIPKNTKISDINNFYKGLMYECRKFNTDIIGGDTVGSDKWVINITVIGKRTKNSGINNFPLRSNLKIGNFIYVSGCVGDSGAGLKILTDKKLKRYQKMSFGKYLIRRHLNPEARIELGRFLSKECSDLGMIDISDGLFNELNLLSKASNIGIEIKADKIPVSSHLEGFCCIVNDNILDYALFGGEDYELLFATKRNFNKKELEKIKNVYNVKITKIGKVTNGKKVVIKDKLGKEYKIENKTFKHF